MERNSTSINFEIWAKKYEEEYRKKKYSIQYGHDLGKKEEKSPYFESISELLQKRGYLLEEEFVSICEWKTERQKNRYKINSADDIRKVTEIVISDHPKIEDQISNLIQLDGVGVPVASALLTVIFPNNYCVLDYRAWRALLWAISEPFGFINYSDFFKTLDNFRNYASEDSYLQYLEKIKILAKKHNMTPRKIEMALWKFDKEGGNVNS